jgi:hypothetical protein
MPEQTDWRDPANRNLQSGSSEPCKGQSHVVCVVCFVMNKTETIAWVGEVFG